MGGIRKPQCGLSVALIAFTKLGENLFVALSRVIQECATSIQT